MYPTKLFLHCGANAVSREQLALAPTPNRTDTWVPIPHDTLVKGVIDSLDGAGMHVVNESHGLTKNGARYFGLLQVANGSNPEDFGLVIGCRNSHDKKFPAALALGANVFVCDNLSFSGEVKLARKHTANIVRDLPQLIGRAVGALGDLRHVQDKRFNAYKTTELVDGQAHDLIIRALDARVLPVTKVPDIISQWRQPNHPEFVQAKNGWRLFNAFTEVLKGNLNELPRRTQALHGLMDSACGLVLPTQVASEAPLAQAT